MGRLVDSIRRRIFFFANFLSGLYDESSLCGFMESKGRFLCVNTPEPITRQPATAGMPWTTMLWIGTDQPNPYKSYDGLDAVPLPEAGGLPDVFRLCS
ncbi:MAG: hypothetical protein COX19_01470 [Desulfobacterales bacterium CG23_combo_of_CG06-09_8_20_14_all_51_8]|nr:MAG: hypothetical protein COX19_01470 [Desulfobacterales bacterium CG23_combo_of_CG06-09_8_20_14_all_51_8]